MSLTRQQTVNDAADPEEVVAETTCWEIEFGEDESVAGWPTVDWQYKRSLTDDWRTRTAGTKAMFRNAGGQPFHPGDVVAYVQVVSGQGSSVFSKHEQ